MVVKRVEESEVSMANLHGLEGSQTETTLLCSCLSLPKLNFDLRPSPPAYIHQATTAFDDSMRETLSDLAGGSLCRIGPGKRHLCQAPSMASISDQPSFMSPAIYISSLDQSRPLTTGIMAALPLSPSTL